VVIAIENKAAQVQTYTEYKRGVDGFATVNNAETRETRSRLFALAAGSTS
jgi:hypothetical protein